MKVCIIGNAGHLEYLHPCPDHVRITGAAPGHTSEKMDRLERYFPNNTLRHYRDYRQMLTSQQPDAVVINPRFDKTAGVLRHCLTTGIHCFVEKPIALNSDDLAAIAHAQSQTGKRIFPMMIHRYQREFFLIRSELLEKGLQPMQLLVQKSYKMGHKEAWMRKKRCFGGLIPWVGTHAFDLIYWIMGMPSTVTAVGTMSGNHGQGEIESSASCLFEFQDGRQATALLNYLRPEAAPDHADDILRVASAQDVIETRGGLLSSASGRLPDASGYRNLPIFEDFARSVQDGHAQRIGTEDALAVCKMALAAEEALQTGEKRGI